MENDSSTAVIFATFSSMVSQGNSFLDDVLVISIWSTILIYAFITNTLTLIGIFRSRKMRRATSYWIVSSLAICDWFMIIISLGHIIPATSLHERYVEIVSARTIWAMFTYNVFWYSGVIQLAAMAVNRFVSIVYPLQYKRIFGPINTLLILVALYLLGLLASVPALFDCCYVLYDHYNYVTYYSPLDSGYMWLDILINTVSVSTMIVCYTAILITVRRSSVRRRKYQLAAKTGGASKTALLIAAATATSSCNTTSRTFAPFLTQNNDEKSMEANGQTIGKQSIVIADQNLSIRVECKRQPFDEPKIEPANDRTSIDAKRRSIADRRRSSTVPNLFHANTNAGPPQEQNITLSYRQKQYNALNALQRQPDKSQQATRREIALFVQFFVVSLVFLSTWVTWQWLPRIPDASKWIYFATTTFFFINNAINPTVYLIFNTGLRHEVREVIYCSWQSERTSDKMLRPSAVSHTIVKRQSSSSD